MAELNESGQDRPPLWEYIPCSDYEVPSAPVIHTAKKNLHSLRQFLHLQTEEQASPLKVDNDLRKLPQWQIERIAHAPDWRNAAKKLSDYLGDWLAQDNPEQPVICLVGPPYSGYANTLAAWTEQQNWPTLKPPTPEHILADVDDWLSEQDQFQDNWVFPNLEKAFFRHTSGLSLVRRFLDRAFSGELGQGVIGCDSWAWAFLVHIWHGQKPLTLTLQACSQDRLTQHIQSIAIKNSGQLHFRQSDNGQYLLPRSYESREADDEEMSNFLQLLANFSRGNLGVAWAVWRDSLRREPNESADETIDETIKEENSQLTLQTVWVPPWDQMQEQLPTLPSGAGRDHAFVLHTLLLHGGLPVKLLVGLLPMSPSQISETLFQLKTAGLIDAYGEKLIVMPRGYPAVRQFLKDNDYLVDQF